MKKDDMDGAMQLFGPDYAAGKMDDDRALYVYSYFWARNEKNLDHALIAAKKTVELSPKPYYWANLSTVYKKLKDYDNAIKALDEAMELEPSTRYYRDQMKSLKKEAEAAK